LYSSVSKKRANDTWPHPDFVKTTLASSPIIDGSGVRTPSFNDSAITPRQVADGAKVLPHNAKNRREVKKHICFQYLFDSVVRFDYKKFTLFPEPDRCSGGWVWFYV